MRSVLLIAITVPVISGFIFETVAPRKGLKQLIEPLTDQRVEVSLEIGTAEDSSRLAVKGMVLDICADPPGSDYEHVKMPGINGPHPNLSAGIRQLNFVQEGSFISQTGTKYVKAEKACWEMCWKEGAPAGSLLCGFEIPEEYKRNDATLPKGRVYMSFPIWTRDTLEHMQDQKKRILERANEALVLKNEELAKMQETGNIFQKALHYRNAAAAAEKYYIQPITRMQLVPSQNEVIAFHDDLFVTSKGTVWAKDLPNGKQILLGVASLKASTPKDIL